MYIIIDGDQIEKTSEITQDDMDMADDGVIWLMRLDDRKYFYNGEWNDVPDRIE